MREDLYVVIMKYYFPFLYSAFLFVYCIFGGIIASIVTNLDVNRNKSKMLIRFLQKYIRELTIEKLYNNHNN